MSDKPIKVTITEPCLIAVPGTETIHAAVGEEHELPAETAIDLVGSGRATTKQAIRSSLKGSRQTREE